MPFFEAKYGDVMALTMTADYSHALAYALNVL